MNGGDDPRGLDLPFRQSGLNLIKTWLNAYYARSRNDHTRLRSLDEISNKCEHKVFVSATSRHDYFKLIQQKLTQATNMRPASSSSVTANHSISVTGNPNPNIPVIQPRNMDSRLKGDETSTSAYYIRSQNYSGASGLSDSGTTNVDQSSQLLMVEFRRVKLSYLPELEKWLKIMERKYSQVQTVSECDNLKKHMVSVRQMIKLLSIAENQLILFNKQKLRHNMNTVIDYFNKFVKNAYQMCSPQRMACTNVTAPLLMNQPVISSSTMNPGFSSGSLTSTEPMDIKSNTAMTNLVTQIHSPETLLCVSQPEKRKKSTNAAATSRTSKKPRSSKAIAKSSGNSHESWLNLSTLRSSKRSSIIPTKLSHSSTPSTPMTPSCGSINGKTEEQVIIEGPVPIVGAPEISSGSPIDCFLDVVKSPMQVNAANDMESASIEMDKLPDIAYDVEPTFGVDLAEFLESMDYDCMNSEDEQPFKRIKRDIQSVTMDASFVPPSDNSASSKLDLLDEIKDANQNLSGTVIEIVEESSNQSNGTIVRCTYSPGAGSADILRSMFASQSMNLSVEFLVPFEYPTSPPKILDYKPPDFGIALEMTEMAKLMLASLVRRNNSSSVSEMAQVWDRCAQSAVLAYEKLFLAEISAPKMVWNPVGPTHNQICNKTCTV